MLSSYYAMPLNLPLLPTTVVGSYPQPDWLIDRSLLAKVPRIRVPEAWRVDPSRLAQAQDDATIVAIHDQERAGLDIISDGEIRRESYSGSFANALSGVGSEPGTVQVVIDGETVDVPVPDFSGAVRRANPVQVGDAAFLRTHTDRVTMVTLPGPFTMSQQAVTSHYRNRQALAMDLAAALNDEVRDLFAAGVDIVQLDEPWMERFPEEARRYGLQALDRALAEAPGLTALHICFGYGEIIADKPRRYRMLEDLESTPVDHVSIEVAQSRLDISVLAEVLLSKKIVVGVLDLREKAVETPALVAERIKRALEVIPAERLIVGPDCGMKFLPREIAFAKLEAMVLGTAVVRGSL
jgi:5-methyltetrahydropteroyltriglutamate--homocysteine methyltransferase